MGSKITQDGEPKFRRLQELKEFTADFRDELGAGSYGKVYKGIDDEGNAIAVKVLNERKGSSAEEEFKREFESLLTLSHPNIIQLVGYCYETEKKYNNVLKITEPVIRTILCFEYAPKGNLGRYMSDYGDKLDWATCYKIIKGTCEGLCYLHNHPSGKKIWHLDLKPENILLHNNMVPKIADFGLSRLMTDQTSKATMTPVGTWKYTPMEFKKKQKISKEFDIYSLGVIILELIAGTKTFEDTDDFTQEVANAAFERWRPKLSPMYYEQVKTCLQIALECLKDRQKRPPIGQIIDHLNKVENMTPKVQMSLGSQNNSGSQEVRKLYSRRSQRNDNTRLSGPIVKHDKGVASQTDTKLDGSMTDKRRNGDEVVLYVTTLSSIGKTFSECNTIRAALEAHHIDFIEKDLFDKPDNLRELKQLLAGSSYRLPVPVLSINGNPVGDAKKLMELHSEGRLQALFK